MYEEDGASRSKDNDIEAGHSSFALVSFLKKVKSEELKAKSKPKGVCFTFHFSRFTLYFSGGRQGSCIAFSN